MTTRYWEAVADSTASIDHDIQCSLCSHRCRLAPGRAGMCRVRVNHDGSLISPFFGQASAVSIDPIEKKPLYHFRPGSRVFSVGFLGCNLHCPFCQNWTISQSIDAATIVYDPEALIKEARHSGSGAIAFTYSEPVVHFEYLMEILPLARRAGLATVLVTNGCLAGTPARELLPLCDAVNIDLKTSSTEKYRRVLGGDLSEVQAFIRLAMEYGVHTELTTLVVSAFNDTIDDFSAAADFVADLPQKPVWHLSAYRPEYHWTAPPTAVRTLLAFAERAQEATPWVYTGNIAGGISDTLCPACGRIAIKRRGYAVDNSGMVQSVDGWGKCIDCSEILPIKT